MTSQFINQLTKKIRILSWVSFLNSIIFFNAIAHAQASLKSNPPSPGKTTLTLSVPSGQWIFQKRESNSNIYVEKNPIKKGSSPYFFVLSFAGTFYQAPMFSMAERKGYYLKSIAYMERFDVDCKTGFLYMNRVTYYGGDVNRMTEIATYGKNDNILDANIVFKDLKDNFGGYEGLNNPEEYMRNLTVLACK